MGFPEIVLAVGTALLVAGAVLLRTRWKAPGEVLTWAGLAALFVSLAGAVFLFHSLPLLAGAAFLGLAAAAAMALLGVRRGVAASLLASLGAFLTVILGITRLVDAGHLLLPVGLLVLVGIAASWKGGWAIGPLLAGGGVFLVLTSDLGKILDGSPGELIGMAVLTAAAFVLARLEPRIEGIAWIVSGMVPLLLAVWPVVAGRESPATLLTGGVLLAGATYGAAWGAPRPARWTALSALAGVAFLALAVSRHGEDRLWWSGLALAGAVLFAGLTLLTARRQSLAAAAPLAAASVLFSAFAVTLEIERSWFEVGLALAVPLLVGLFPKLPSPPLRSLTLVLTAFSVLWLGLGWKDFGIPDGGLVDFPWLLYGYGVPLAAMLVGVWLARRQGEVRVANRLEWAALGFLLLLVLFSVRQIFPGTGMAFLVLLGVGIFLAFGAYRARWEPRAASVRLLLFFSVALGATGVEAAGQARLYTRPVDVPAEGWGRVPLDLATLRHLGAEGEGVRVFGPDGQEARSRLEPFPREGERSFNSASVLNLGSDVPDDAAWIDPGPESAGELPPLPGRLIRPAVRQRGSFGSSWTVESRGVSPGEIVRLEIPEEVYARSLADLADVRLEVGGQQIPYVRRSLDEPARVVEVRGAPLEKRFLGIGNPRLHLSLPQPRLPLVVLAGGALLVFLRKKLPVAPPPVQG